MKDKTRTQKAVLNMVTSGIYGVVAFVCGLILPRMILAHYGSAYNGIATSANQFLSFITILTLGVSGSTRVVLYTTLANKDNKGTSAIVKATEQYMRKVGITLLAYIIILATVYPVAVNTGFGYWDVFLLIIAVGISSFGDYFFGAAYKAFLTAAQMIYISNIISIITTLLNTILAATLMNLGFSFQVVKFASAFVFILKPVAQNIYVSKRFRIDKKCLPDRTALRMRKDVMIHSIANIIHDKTDIIVLTIFSGVGIVSVYSIYNLVMIALNNLRNVLVSGTESIFGEMYAKGESKNIEKNLSNYEYVITCFVSIVFSVTMIMILPFVSLYTSVVTDVEYVLPYYAIVITIAQAFYCIRSPYLALVQGAGKYKETRRGAIIEASLNLTISIVLVQIIGIVGVAIGTLVANVFRTIQYALFVDNHIVKRGKTVFIKRILWTFINIGLATTICYYTVYRFSYDGWVNWILSASIATIICVITTIVSSVFFWKKDLVSTIAIFQRMIKVR